MIDIVFDVLHMNPIITREFQQKHLIKPTEAVAVHVEYSGACKVMAFQPFVELHNLLWDKMPEPVKNDFISAVLHGVRQVFTDTLIMAHCRHVVQGESLFKNTSHPGYVEPSISGVLIEGKVRPLKEVINQVLGAGFKAETDSITGLNIKISLQ